MFFFYEELITRRGHITSTLYSASIFAGALLLVLVFLSVNVRGEFPGNHFKMLRKNAKVTSTTDGVVEKAIKTAN